MAALNYQEKMLYWVDALEDVLEQVAFDGSNRKIISDGHVSVKFSGILVYLVFVLLILAV